MSVLNVFENLNSTFIPVEYGDVNNQEPLVNLRTLGQCISIPAEVVY